MYAALEGYFDKRKEDAALLRRATWRLHQTFAGKEALTEEDFMPFSESERNDVNFIVEPDMIEKIKKAHNIP